MVAVWMLLPLRDEKLPFNGVVAIRQKVALLSASLERGLLHLLFRLLQPFSSFHCVPFVHYPFPCLEGLPVLWMYSTE